MNGWSMFQNQIYKNPRRRASYQFYFYQYSLILICVWSLDKLYVWIKKLAKYKSSNYPVKSCQFTDNHLQTDSMTSNMNISKLISSLSPDYNIASRSAVKKSLCAREIRKETFKIEERWKGHFITNAKKFHYKWYKSVKKDRQRHKAISN